MTLGFEFQLPFTIERGYRTLKRTHDFTIYQGQKQINELKVRTVHRRRNREGYENKVHPGIRERECTVERLQ